MRARHTYAVKEIFRTLQGEGAQTGTPMVFVRLAGCNLWTGREEDRARAVCDFCDTDFVGGERLDAAAIVARVRAQGGPAWVCVTGGEPALQLDAALCDALHAAGYRIALETNGTVDIAALALDWVCVSPKTRELAVAAGDELKLVYRGQPDDEIRRFEGLRFGVFSLQPEWGARYEERLRGAIAFVERQPKWRLSLQTHKLVGLR